jgi:uncharacterized NAD(P)/FAD-binding protein YdhS
MGAFPDDITGFATWLEGSEPTAFVPRRRYGDYLEALLAQAQAGGAQIEISRAEIADIRRTPAGRTLVDAAGRAVLAAKRVVLAVGAPPPAGIVPQMSVAVREHPGYIADPWRFLGAPAFAPRGDILIAGSGLTALDVIAAFARSGAPNRVCVVSRGGRFPLPHASVGAPVDALPSDARPDSIREIVALVRSAVREAGTRDVDWRCVMDGLRPRIAGLWSALDLTERRRFLRHVRPLFDPHRHRAPAELLAAATELARVDRLELRAGRFVRIEPTADGLDATLTFRATGAPVTKRVAQIINCLGPANDYTLGGDSLIGSLRERGELIPDPTGLGVRARDDGALIDADGHAHDDLFAIGWPLRGTFFETTAVRELREHAARLGRALAASCDARAAAMLATARASNAGERL